MSTKVSDPSSIKALLVSNNQLLFSGLQAILSGVTAVAMAHGNGDFDKAVGQAQPQLIILDMELHGNLTQLIHKIKETIPDAKILVLFGLNEMEATRQALTSGIDGVVLKMQPQEVLLAAVTALIHSSPSAGPGTANGCGAPRGHIADRPASLTRRERDIVRLVSQGLSNKEIADQTCMAVITVRHHLTRIFDKLGVASRQKLLIHAHQEGMAQPVLSDTV